MRSSRFAPMLLGALAAGVLATGAAQPDPKLPTREEEDREKEAAKRAHLAREQAPARPRTLTEADNTRLREAAEKRFRKAQRQALGMRPPADHDASVLSPQGSDSAPAPDEL